jgi:uncharacterized protein (DUF1684 family)
MQPTEQTHMKAAGILIFQYPDIKDTEVIVDFNKAYNPYCCYTSGYDCPIPPKENALPIAVNAGEMKYTKPVH